MNNTVAIPESLSKNIKFLTPRSDADPHYTYTVALTKAINDKYVTNIAISGPYGAGKSSILKTFIERQKNKDEYLQVSLANFEQKDGDDVGLRIEKSILQQMFYKVERNQVPYSKLKRIVAPESVSLTGWASYLLVFAAVLYLELNPKEMVTIFDSTWMLYIINFIFLAMVFFGLRSAAMYLSKIKLEKIVIKDTEFNLGEEETNGSLINRHLDEILYFFESTKYKVLIIEDLDRFDNIGVYEKLRELNTLVNNYEKIKSLKGKIVFIYAIKDNFFVGENRSKFFDVIIPVVPYINASGNARDILVKELRNAGLKEEVVSEQLLKDISKFIYDHRLLINIINEYLIYLNEFNPGLQEENKLDQEKLFCMIVYKNFFPADFADLHQSKGWLYDLFSKKKKALNKNFIEDIDAKIDEIHSTIREAEQESLNNEIELRAAYMHNVLTNSHVKPRDIQINSTYYKLSQIIDDPSLFEKFIATTTISFIDYSNYSQNMTLVHSKENYLQRLTNIQNKEQNKLDELNAHLSALKVKRPLLFSADIATMILENKDHGVFDDLETLYRDAGYNDDEVNHKLVSPNILVYFIREGKIDEDYASYISYFHEGGILTRSDNDFIMRIIEGQILDINHSIDNPKLVIEEISKSKFLEPAILNIQMIETLFADEKKYKTYCENVFHLLSGDELAQQFIPIFIAKRSIEVSKFLCFFAEHQKNFWERLERFNLDQAELFNALACMLESCQKETLLAQGKVLSDFIFRCGNFIFTKTTPAQTSMLLMLLPQLTGKFSFAAKPIGEDGKKLLLSVYEFNLYELNPYMIALMIQTIGEKNYSDNIPVEQIAEYSHITTSNLAELINYVEENVDSYVMNVYLKTLNDDEYPESYTSICYMLNHKYLDENIKYKIIEQMQVILDNVEDIGFDEDIWPTLFQNLKINPTWENVFTYYIEMSLSFELDESLLKYLSNLEIALSLSKQMIAEENFDMLLFSKALIFNTQIQSNLLQLYRSCIEPFDDISMVPGESLEKLSDVFEAGFINITQKNYEYLRAISGAHQNNFHIKLLEKDFTLAMDFIYETDVNDGDMLSILSNKHILAIERYNYLTQLSLTLFDTHNMADVIANLLYTVRDDVSIQFPTNLFDLAINSSISIDSKVEILLHQLPDMSYKEIYACLNALGAPYSDLIPSQTGKNKLHFSRNKHHTKLFEDLRTLNIVGKVHHEDDEIVVNKNKKMR